MAKQRSDVSSVLVSIERGGGRSTLFHWMVEHHDDLSRRWATAAIRWAQLARAFQSLGLTDRDGKPASGQAARRTWLRARKAVQQERSYQATGVRTAHAPVPVAAGRFRSSVDAGSRAMPSPATNPAMGIRPAAGSPVSKEAVEAKLAALQKTLDERSGR